jgi:hypothetical protein
MKLKIDKKEFSITGNGFEEKEFSIDTNSDMIIKLLRDKMYQNKIGAVCREVISNSRDANRENNKSDTPVKVELIHDKSFIDDEYKISFSDEGIGISPERMDNIFLRYGSSTKRDTNNYTGGFGIGAKTPFAYTDEFLIDTVVNITGENVLFQYQALITSDGERESSKMILINTEKTKQNTGTKITIPVQQEDIEEFGNELIYTTLFWGVKPKFVGFNFENKKELKIVYERNEFMFVKNQNVFGDNSYIILIDEIPYVFDNKKLQEINDGLSKKFMIKNDDFKFVLKFNTGEITVSGSREDVEYTKENIKKIIQRNNFIISEGEKMIKEKIEQASSYSKACKNASKIFNYNMGYIGLRINYLITEGVFEFLALIYNENLKINPSDYKYKSQEVFYRVNFNKYFFIKIINKGGKMMKDSSLSRFYSHKDWDLPMYLFDVEKQNTLQSEYLKEKHPNGYVLIFDKSKMNENAINSFKRYFTYSEDSMNTKYRWIKDSMWIKTKKEESEIIQKLGLNIIPYSQVPKLKKDNFKEKKEKFNYIKLPLKNYISRTHEWQSITIDFYKDKNKTDYFEDIKKVACFKTDSLSNLKKGDYNIISGMTLEQTIKTKILITLGYTIIAFNSSKEKYINNLGIKSIEKIFNELVDENKDLTEAVQYVLTLKLNLGSDVNSKFLHDLNFDSKYKDAFKVLEKDLNITYDKIVNDNIIKNFVRIFDNAKDDFFKVFKLEKKIELDLFNEFLNKNPLISAMLKLEESEYYFTTREWNIEGDKKVLDDMKKQILTLFQEK